MKSFSSLTTRTVALAAVALAGFAGASSAQARDNVQFSVSVGNPGYVQPAPVYVQPRPVYVQPRPVYVQPAPVYVQRGGAWGDRDRDGVPNRFDRFPTNPYYR